MDDRALIASAVSLDAHPSWREIDLGALEHNYREIVRRVGPGKRIIASLKANAYSHGVVSVARKLEKLGVYCIATGSPADVIAIRNAGIRTRILCFATALPGGLGALIGLGACPTIHDRETAKDACAD